MSFFKNLTNSNSNLNLLKVVLSATVVIGVSAALLDALIPYLFHLPGPQAWLCLSNWGLKSHFYWQLFTHMFVFQPSGGLNLRLLFHVFLNIYFLWMVGSYLITTKGEKDFLTLFFGSGLFTGVTAALVMHFIPSQGAVFGLSAPLYALIVAWMMLNSELQVLLFFVLPIKVKWLIQAIFAINVLVLISEGNFLSFFVQLSPVIFGYAYSILAWKINSPFTYLHKIENHLIKFSIYMENLFNKTPSYDPFSAKAKVYDFKTGRAILSDEEYMDACLEKIAKFGKGSLSFFERWKMKKISKKKKKNPSKRSSFSQ